MKHNHTSSLSREEKEKRRMKAGKMFRKGLSQADVARKLDVSTAAVSGWHHAWKKRGLRGLESKGAPGFDSELTEKDREKLRKAILQGARKFGYDSDLWTLARIAAVMNKLTGHSFGHTWTWQIVLSLGFTCQKPEKRAKERDEEAIREWREKTFPRLKKMGSQSWIYAGISG